MPVSQGNVSTGPSGMTLKAWCLIDSTGALIKGFNVSSTSRVAAGNFVVNFTSNMTGTNYFVRHNIHNASNGPGGYVSGVNVNGKLVNSFGFAVVNPSFTLSDPPFPLHLEIYE